MKLFFIIIIRLLSYLDYFFRRFTKIFISPPFKRVGVCNQCGQCCRYIIFSVDPKILKSPRLKSLVIRWNSYFNKLIFIEEIPEKSYMAFTCEYLGKDGRCQSYNLLRPLFCYEYPRTYGYFEEPTTLPDCGYHFQWKGR